MLEVSIGFGMGLLALMTSQVIAHYYRYPQAWAFVALLIGVAGFFILPTVDPDSQWLFLTIQTSIPAVFWLNCQLAFNDKFNWQDGIWIAAIYSVLGPAFAFFFELNQELQWRFLLIDIPQYLEFLLIALGFYSVVSNWSADLDETRRLMRGWTLVIIGSAIAIIVISIQLGGVDKRIQFWAANVTIFLTAVMLLRARTEQLTAELKSGQLKVLPVTASIEPGREIENPDNEDDRYLIKLNSLMLEGFYRTDGLTIAKLAKEIDLPEYRTRQLINRQLGYKNFNDYIHQLRIKEATERLLADMNVPVLNISLDVGYRTLSSFNRAFKDINGMSPTEYRAQAEQSASIEEVDQ